MTAQPRKSRLKFFSSVLRQRYSTGLAIGVPVMGLFALLAILSPAHYRAFGQVKLLSSESGPPPAESPAPPPSLDADLDALKSNLLIASTVQKLQQAGRPIDASAQKNIKRSLKLQGNPNQQTIALTYDDPNAENAATIINQHMEVFQSHKQQTQEKIRTQVKRQIENRIPQARAEVTATQNAIRKFQEQFQFVTTTTSASSAALAYKQAQQELEALQQQNTALEAQRKQLLAQLGVSAREAETLAAVSRSKEFRKLIRELRQLQSQLNRKQSQFTEQHPEVIDLKRDIMDLRTGLNAEIQRITGNQSIELNLLLARETKQILTSELVELENQRGEVLGRAQQLSQSLGQLKKNALELPQLEQQYQTLERQLTQAQKNLDGLLRQRKDILDTLNSRRSEVQVLERAEVPRQKIAPFQMPLIWGGFLTSLGLGGLGMWISEIRDRSLKTVADAEQYLGLRVLGVLPTFEPSAPAQLYDGDLQRNIPAIFPVDQPGSAVSEAFRMLYLNLKVLPETKNIQSLAITSSIPQEGKSTIAANLAAVLAQAGKSVLLIDANLHHPFQSLIWNLPNEIGLSDILFSQTSFLLAVNPISSNLDILTSGSIKTLDRNPFESKQMTVFIAEMSSRYDYLLFDLPSVNVSADAAIISQMVDGVLFVSKPGLLDEFNASKAQSLLVRAKANLLGMILNGSNDPRDTFLPQDGDEIDEEFQEDWLDLTDDPGEEEPDFSNLGRAQLQPGDGKMSFLDQQSLPELERQLEELQAQWAASKRLLDSKEEELIHLCHVRKEFEVELNQMSLSLATADNRGPQLEALNEKIRKTDARREYLLRNIKSLREQIKVEQNTFYAHLKVLQSQHSQAALTGDPPTI